MQAFGPANISKDADVQVLEAAVKVMSDELNALIASCHDNDGKLKSPDKKAIMRARSMLPPRYSYALNKTGINK